MTLKELREKRNQISAQINAILDAVKATEDGIMTAEQTEQVETLEGQFAATDTTIKAMERQEARKPANPGRKFQPQDGTIDGSQITDVKDAIEDDPKRGFANHREFFLAVKSHRDGLPPIESNNPKLRNWARHIYTEAGKMEATAGSDEQSTFADPYGGFLVPAGIMQGGLLSVDPDSDPLAGRTTPVSMGATSVEIPYRVDKTHTTSVSGGLQWTRREEAGTMTASRMEIARFRLNAYSLYGMTYSTEELLRDSPQSVVSLIQAGFQTELGSRLLDERLNGTGVGEFSGINNSPALISIAKETGQAADSIVYENIIKARAQVWGYGNAIWLANQDCLPQLMLMNQSVGTGGIPVWQPSAREDHPDVLLGRPLFFNEHMNTVGDAGDIICINPTQYLEGVYEPLQSAESMHVRFTTHERTFKFWLRNAGGPWWDAALTPKKSAKTLSPFVRLAAR